MSSNQLNRFSKISLLSICLLIISQSADAGVTLCNKENFDFYVTEMRHKGDGFVSLQTQGWYVVKKGQCLAIFSGQLPYYAYYAFMVKDKNGNPISKDFHPEEKFGSGVSRSNNKFCVHPREKFRRTGSVEYLQQCPAEYKLAHFPLLVEKGICPYDYNNQNPTCQFDYTINISFPKDNLSTKLVNGPPVDQKAENIRIAAMNKANEALADLAFIALEMYMPLSQDSKSRRATLNDRLPPMRTVNKRAHMSCRKTFRWATEIAEKRLCICGARRIRFDMFSEKQMRSVDKNFSNFGDYLTGRINSANRNIFADCIAFYCHLNIGTKAPAKRARDLSLNESSHINASFVSWALFTLI